VLADKAYDADWLRRQIEAAGAAPNIPPMVHRRRKPCFSPVLYPSAQPHRAVLQPHQTLPVVRHAIRKARRELPCHAAVHLWLRHNERVA
jgi:hypothetical protein